MTTPRNRRGRLLGCAMAVTLAAGLAACDSGEGDDHPKGTVTEVVPAPQQGGVTPGPSSAQSTPPPPPASPPAAPGGPPGDAAAALERIAAELPANSGVAVAPVGRGPESRGAGPLTTGAAWSTSKVPLSLAALRHDPGVRSNADAALVKSDNESAEALWNSLGGGQQAATAMQQVLAEAGDTVTQVPAEKRRQEFSVFGQTDWTLVDQARFTAGLACLPDAQQVLEPMTRVDASQRWGLGTIPGAAYKGGWGPNADGSGYLTRQLAILPTPSGRVAVTIAVSGVPFEQGTASLTRIAGLVQRELGALPAGECGAPGGSHG